MSSFRCAQAADARRKIDFMSLQTQDPRHEEERQDQEGERLEALGRVEGVVPGLSVALADFLAARCEFSVSTRA